VPSPILPSNTGYDIASDFQDLGPLRSDYPFANTLPTSNGPRTLQNAFWNTETTATDVPRCENNTPPTMPSDGQAVASDRLWHGLEMSVPLKSFLWPSTPPSTCFRGAAVENKSIDPRIMDVRKDCGLVQTVPIHHSIEPSHCLYLHSPESSLQGHVPVSAAPRTVQEDSQQSLHSSPIRSRRERRKPHSEGSITHGQHVITKELPWQAGRVLPDEASECSFHTFSLNEKPVEHNRRRLRCKQQLEDMKNVRRLKACLPCRRAKVRVSTSLSTDTFLLRC
jgi:hypothetical protein